MIYELEARKLIVLFPKLKYMNYYNLKEFS